LRSQPVRREFRFGMVEAEAKIASRRLTFIVKIKIYPCR
jgi:hypothetical protein